MGVTLRTGPDGSVYVSDWSDTGECHTANPDRTTGRIYKISFGPPKDVKPDLYKLSDMQLVEMQLHKNDYYVRHARRILQERAVDPNWNKLDTVTALTRQFRTLTEPQRLRAMWALHVIGRPVPLSRDLLTDPHEHVRAWAVQLACEQPPPAGAVELLAERALHDPSPAVRLAIASALQRLPLDQRWKIAAELLFHPDGVDPNLPLMIWYGVEPLVPVSPIKALELAEYAEIPLVRQFIARRVVDDAFSKGETADLTPLVVALARTGGAKQLDLLRGIREGTRGRAKLPLPAGWSALYVKLHASPDKEARDHAAVLALTFGDPQALKDLTAEVKNVHANPADRTAALEALIEKRVPELVPLLFEELADKDMRRTALRGLAAVPHADTPKKILAAFSTLTNDEKAAAVATLTARKEYALALLDAVEEKTVPRAEISAYAARQMVSLRDARLTERVRTVWGDVKTTTTAKTREQVAKYKVQLTPDAMKAADLSNGRLVFSKTCQACHKLFGEGGKIGPDLTGSNRQDLTYLLTNVIDPSAEVARDYRMSTVRMKDDRVITGIVAERTPARVTVQTATERIVLSPDDVDEIKDSALSLMPEGQLDPMTKEQVRDLFAYLGTKTQVPMPAEKPKGR
jgi:putative heme-binding domain-containing protein